MSMNTSKSKHTQVENGLNTNPMQTMKLKEGMNSMNINMPMDHGMNTLTSMALTTGNLLLINNQEINGAELPNSVTIMEVITSGLKITVEPPSFIVTQKEFVLTLGQQFNEELFYIKLDRILCSDWLIA